MLTNTHTHTCTHARKTHTHKHTHARTQAHARTHTCHNYKLTGSHVPPFSHGSGVQGFGGLVTVVTGGLVTGSMFVQAGVQVGQSVIWEQLLPHVSGVQITRYLRVSVALPLMIATSLVNVSLGIEGRVISNTGDPID